MKKHLPHPLSLAGSLLLTMLLVSCADHTLSNTPLTENSEGNQNVSPTALRSVTDQLYSIDSDALAYCNNVKTIMYGTYIRANVL